jgi:hypothetical protein
MRGKNPVTVTHKRSHREAQDHGYTASSHYSKSIAALSRTWGEQLLNTSASSGHIFTVYISLGIVIPWARDPHGRQHPMTMGIKSASHNQTSSTYCKLPEGCIIRVFTEMRSAQCCTHSPFPSTSWPPLPAVERRIFF